MKDFLWVFSFLTIVPFNRNGIPIRQISGMLSYGFPLSGC